MTQACRRCIYDANTPGISFDAEGICNYCRSHEQMEMEYPTGEAGRKKLEELAAKIKQDQKKREFDCVIGVSGGCDSSFLCHIAKEELGLRPLAVHFDNTWNSKIAVENIHRVLRKLDIELWTYVMDNDEWNDLARSFLKASVPEIDALTDVALTTTLYMAAEKYKIKYIFNGHSFRTEGMTPLGWFYFDGKYIQSIHDAYGSMPMERFPNLWLSTWMKWLLQDYKRLRPLYYVDYRKDETKKMLAEKYDWQWYGGHHMENRYTVFCDNYILPRKFGIDIRYVEFSALIRSGQMTREDALEKIKEPPEFDEEILTEVKKRLDLTDEEFDQVIGQPKRNYRDFKTYHETFRRLRPFFYLMYKTNRVPKSFYLKYTK
ncbi:MAG: N-acetyl sugar amidotransferase [Methanomassiliicoccales archaeon]|nr:N-acetyl sugar amidotransferase [Methanomassiliicoccales archaeon]